MLHGSSDKWSAERSTANIRNTVRQKGCTVPIVAHTTCTSPLRHCSCRRILRASSTLAWYTPVLIFPPLASLIPPATSSVSCRSHISDAHYILHLCSEAHVRIQTFTVKQ